MPLSVQTYAKANTHFSSLLNMHINENLPTASEDSQLKISQRVFVSEEGELAAALSRCQQIAHNT